MGLLLDNRQCAMLAEMGVRVFLPQCDAAAAAVCLPDSATATTAIAVNETARHQTTAQTAAVPPALAQDKTVPAACAATPQAALRKPARAPVHAGTQPAPHAVEPASCSLCLGVQRSGQGDGAGATDAADAPLRWLFVCDVLAAQAGAFVPDAQSDEGNLLRNMAASVGVQLAQISHSPKSAVPVAPAAPATNGDTPPAPDANWLLHEIARLQPHIIVALGRPAAAALLGGEQALGRMRGQAHHLAVPAHEADLQAALAHIPVVASYPLDYLLRAPQAKANAWQDLCLAWSLTEKTA